MFDRCIYFNLNSLVRELNRIWEAEFERIDLSPSLGYLLVVVLETPGLPQKELAAKLRLDRSTVTRFIDALIERKLVQRRQEEGDARVARIFPTAAGTALKPRLAEVMASLARRMGREVKEGDYKDLLCLSQRVRESILAGKDA